MNPFASSTFKELSASSPTMAHKRDGSLNTAADDQFRRQRLLHLALETCEASTESADRSLQVGNSTAARCAFKQAEAAFEEAQWYLLEINREDWRKQIECALKPLGVKLDGLWVKLMSADVPSRVSSIRRR